MKKRLLFTLLTLGIAGALLFMPTSAYANTQCVKIENGKEVAVQGICCGKDASGNSIMISIDLGNRCTDGASTVTALLLYVLDFLAAGVGIAVVIGIVWGGLVYAQSDGDASQAKEGNQIIVNAVIGLLLFIFMYAAVNFFVPGGLFN